MTLRSALGVLLVVHLAGPANAQEALPSTIDAFDRVFGSWMLKHDIRGGSLAVAREGRLVFAKGYGRIKAGDRVLLGSLSKAVTAVCVATLVGDGKLRFHSTVGEVLDRHPARLAEPHDPRVRTITLEQLLIHRGGFGDDATGDPAGGERLAGLLREKRPRDITMADLWRRVARLDLGREPGEAYRYSNASYLALGLMIEVASGQPYEDYCKSTVLAPQGVTGAGLHPTWRVLSAFGGWSLSGPEYLAFLEVFAPGGSILGEEIRRWLTSPAGKQIDDTGRVFYSLGVLVRPLPDGGYNLFHTGGWTYDLAAARGGPLKESLGTLAVYANLGASWFAFFEPRPSGDARAELDRELHRAARAVRAWPEGNEFPRFGLR